MLEIVATTVRAVTCKEPDGTDELCVAELLRFAPVKQNQAHACLLVASGDWLLVEPEAPHRLYNLVQCPTIFTFLFFFSSSSECKGVFLLREAIS